MPGHGLLNVFVSHFSFDRKQQLSNVLEVKEFVLESPTPQILMGTCVCPFVLLPAAGPR